MTDNLPTWAQEALERAEAATEGPWEWEAGDASMLGLGTKGLVFFEGSILACERCKSCVDADKPCMWPEKKNADFIAGARTDVPRLCEALAEALAALEPLARIATSHNGTIPGSDYNLDVRWYESDQAKITVGDACRAAEVLEKLKEDSQ